jgi:hypothetical protein
VFATFLFLFALTHEGSKVTAEPEKKHTPKIGSWFKKVTTGSGHTQTNTHKMHTHGPASGDGGTRRNQHRLLLFCFAEQVAVTTTRTRCLGSDETMLGFTVG